MYESDTTWGDRIRLLLWPAMAIGILVGAAVTGSDLNGVPGEQIPDVSPAPDHYQTPAAPLP